MLNVLRSKVEMIAENYADLVAGRLQKAILKSEVNSTAMTEINEGIRMLNHVASTLERIDRLGRGNDADGSTKD